MLQELTVKEVERLSNLKIPNKVEIEKVLEMINEETKDKQKLKLEKQRVWSSRCGSVVNESD